MKKKKKKKALDESGDVVPARLIHPTITEFFATVGLGVSDFAYRIFA